MLKPHAVEYEHDIDRVERNLPAFLQDAAKTPEMQRLKGIDMTCGCVYTDLPAYRNYQRSCFYSRYDHSLRTAQIVWHFTQDRKQALAALFHDIAAPVFSHCVDYLYGDEQRQEKTEEYTGKIIEASESIQAVLAENALETRDVCDPHRYPVLDSEIPRLSADRLEAVFSNLLASGIRTLPVIQHYYDDLVLCEEKGVPELAFRTTHTAVQFAYDALHLSRLFLSNEDRYTMQFVAKMLRDAIERGLLTKDDLWTEESQVIRKLQADSVSACKLYDLRHISGVIATKYPLSGLSVKASGKRRNIDPLLICKPAPRRVSEVSLLFRQERKSFLDQNLDVYLTRFDDLPVGSTVYVNLLGHVLPFRITSIERRPAVSEADGSALENREEQVFHARHGNSLLYSFTQSEIGASVFLNQEYIPSKQKGASL